MASQAFTDTSWTGHFTIISQNALVDEAIPWVGFDLSSAPASFWSAVRSNGGDIRVANSLGTTEYSREIVGWDYVGNKGWVFFDCSADLATGSNVTWRIYAGNGSATEPIVTAVNGRNNVWHVNDQGIWHLNEDPSGTAPQIIDSTGNGNSGTSSGTMTTSDLVAATIGKGLDFDKTDDYINVGNAAALAVGDFSLFSVFKTTGAVTTTGVIINQSAPNSTVWVWLLRVNSNGTVTCYLEKDVGGIPHLTATSTGTVDDGLYHTVGAKIDGNLELRIYIDGAEDGNDTTPDTTPVTGNTSNVAIGGQDNASTTNTFDGIIDEVLHTQRLLSANAFLTMDNFFLSNSSFWSTGVWVGGGSTPPPHLTSLHSLHPLHPMTGVA